jgi:predicted SAM-dependent methyltransferase
MSHDLFITFKRIILKRFKKTKNIYYAYIDRYYNKNLNVECPICGWKGKEFMPYGILEKTRRNSLCPKCGSSERSRVYFLYLKNKIPTNRKLKVLHFAPEKVITKLFKSYNNIEYLSADINPKKAMIKEDITRISFADNSFDIIFCSHVLEHIEHDRMAMRELYRIIKPEGFAILQVPIKNRENTFEDFNIKDPMERKKVFGHSDHVRIYGKDYIDRLKESGFNVKVDRFSETLDKSTFNKYSLSKDNLFICTKNSK